MVEEWWVMGDGWVVEVEVVEGWWVVGDGGWVLSGGCWMVGDG